MRTILVFNDNSSEAANASEFAVNIAQKVKADILILNLLKQGEKVPVQISAKHENTLVENATNTGLPGYLYSLSKNNGFKPVISDIDASEFTVENICELVIRKDIWLMVKGLESVHVTHSALIQINVQSILNRVACPLLLIPGKYQ